MEKMKNTIKDVRGKTYPFLNLLGKTILVLIFSFSL